MGMIRSAALAAIATAAVMALPATASASTECQAKVSRIWVGDGGHVYIFLANGPAAVLTPTDPNREAALAAAMTAQSTGRSVTVRFSADGVSCTTVVARFDFVGLYLESF
ncbi:hypothetical protein [Caulobacter sp. UNC279MFTsu5.1]|uniref:hypothetical protein n=1 Tax=Caulobacter sp. UNC279MFTsu5.1 TaxID=1502775 RepID=UPI0008EEDDF0|nr:hypothetical protein [Caulobacter sp. UNC279MFTsu5.1]SFJ58658.1 hypothetical protein SAMN02799626_02123 [Caulobacter sp. UNC279MFTsu5.1]